ncbi:hypothetical protein ACIRF8_05570 [Streptomyces sp. NPDC102406]|uniref:hypothetical protein n=1 Tax=Streptomyces sp. NPDC102406 TaxID=3366171 RepID=UPI0038242B28
MTDINRTRQDGTAPDRQQGPLAGETPPRDRTAPGTRDPRHEPGNQVPGAGAPLGGDPLAGPGPDEGVGRHRDDHRAPHRDSHFEPRHDLEGPAHGARSDLVAHEAREDLEGRLRHAVAAFVDEPRASVEEADHVLEDLTTRLTESLAGRRSALRTTWQDSKEDTEQLRLALRDYRETAERLLSL